MKYIFALLLFPLAVYAGSSGEGAASVSAPQTTAAPATQKTMDLTQATARAEQWFNSVKTLKADFSQTTQNAGQLGRVQTGTFYLNRPTQFLWQYAMPVRQKIISTGAYVFFHDEESGQTTQIPRSMPLVKLLTAKTVSFSDDTFKPLLATQTAKGFSLRIALMEDGFEEGQFTLSFKGKPAQLTTIRMMDALGSTNTIRLTNMRTGLQLNKKLFRFTPPQYEEN